MNRLIATLLLLSLLISCAHIPSQIDRRLTADRLAIQQNWMAHTISTSHFALFSYQPTKIKAHHHLTLYIEGDGLAWISSSQPSKNPTPLNPIALKLALAQPEGNAAYLARPCQYINHQDRFCEQDYWTSKRFAPEVINSTNQAVEQLKSKFSAKTITLVGYSGGGAVAALVASLRADVIKLVTIAGNLDHKAWTKHHHISPLLGSLNPTDYWHELERIPQVHLVGAKDRIVPLSVFDAYQSAFPVTKKPLANVIMNFDHQCCWVKIWPTLKLWEQLR